LPSRIARVFMLPTSEPDCGSVIATAVMVRPLAIAGKKRWRGTGIEQSPRPPFSSEIRVHGL